MMCNSRASATEEAVSIKPAARKKRDENFMINPYEQILIPNYLRIRIFRKRRKKFHSV
jgi:hypothetical protein